MLASSVGYSVVARLAAPTRHRGLPSSVGSGVCHYLYYLFLLLFIPQTPF
ncbi:MAG: hypothetical protein IJ785_00895 [Bacteroidales bacterium]|nr:hypothetical protein [Bacteroidales bacterium]